MEENLISRYSRWNLWLVREVVMVAVTMAAASRDRDRRRGGGGYDRRGGPPPPDRYRRDDYRRRSPPRYERRRSRSRSRSPPRYRSRSPPLRRRSRSPSPGYYVSLFVFTTVNVCLKCICSFCSLFFSTHRDVIETTEVMMGFAEIALLHLVAQMMESIIVVMIIVAIVDIVRRNYIEASVVRNEKSALKGI